MKYPVFIIQKLLLNSQKCGSGIRKKLIPDPDPWEQKAPGPQHCILCGRICFPDSVAGNVPVGLDLGPDPDPTVQNCAKIRPDPARSWVFAKKFRYLKIS